MLEMIWYPHSPTQNLNLCEITFSHFIQTVMTDELSIDFIRLCFTTVDPPIVSIHLNVLFHQMNTAGVMCAVNYSSSQSFYAI